MARELAATVYLQGENADVSVLRAGTAESELSAEQRKQITNPSAWREVEKPASSKK